MRENYEPPPVVTAEEANSAQAMYRFVTPATLPAKVELAMRLLECQATTGEYKAATGLELKAAAEKIVLDYLKG